VYTPTNEARNSSPNPTESEAIAATIVYWINELIDDPSGRLTLALFGNETHATNANTPTTQSIRESAPVCSDDTNGTYVALCLKSS